MNNAFYLYLVGVPNSLSIQKNKQGKKKMGKINNEHKITSIVIYLHSLLEKLNKKQKILLLLIFLILLFNIISIFCIGMSSGRWLQIPC